jgi:hypothetical protein
MTNNSPYHLAYVIPSGAVKVVPPAVAVARGGRAKLWNTGASGLLKSYTNIAPSRSVVRNKQGRPDFSKRVGGAWPMVKSSGSGPLLSERVSKLLG